MIRAFMMEVVAIMLVVVAGQELCAVSFNKTLGGVKIDRWKISSDLGGVME